VTAPVRPPPGAERGQEEVTVLSLLDPAATPDSVRPQAEQMRTMNASLSPEQFAVQSRMALVGMISDPVRVDMANMYDDLPFLAKTMDAFLSGTSAPAARGGR
jgi:hypothetical protein